MSVRLTRKEKQAQTRSCLLASAARVFARRGLEGSIDEIAQEAGYTKGAFYANFKSKEELFLAMLDERFAEKLDEIDAIAGDGLPVEEQAREAGDVFSRALRGDPEWHRLFFEFAAYAARDEDFRQELVARYGALRERLAEITARRAEELGIDLPVPPSLVAAMGCAMIDGLAIQGLLDPEAVPDEAYGALLAIFFTGLRALAE